jgi:hypothetical protein
LAGGPDVLNGTQIIAIFDLTGWKLPDGQSGVPQGPQRMIRRSVGGLATGTRAVKLALTGRRTDSIFTGRARQSRFERTL